MCGNSGVAGWITELEKKVAHELLIMNIVRGTDATGIANVPRDRGPFKVIKALGTPFGDMIDSPGIFAYKAYDNLLKLSAKALIGHNRSATRGEVTALNAHPFKFDNVVGSHNGTLESSSVKHLTELANQKFGTDSETIFACIEKVGIQETVKQMEGAWALIWYDRRDDTINFLRNDERTLHYIFSEDGKTMFWSSDYSPLMYTLARQKIRIAKDDKPKLFPANQWMSWKIPEVASVFGEARQEEAKGFFPLIKTYASPGATKYWPTTGGKGSNSGADLYSGNGVSHLHHSTGDTNGAAAQSAQAFLPKQEGSKGGKIINLPTTYNHTAASVTNIADSATARSTIMQNVLKKSELLFGEQCGKLLGRDWILKHFEFRTKVFYDTKTEEWFHFTYSVPLQQWTFVTLPHAPRVVPLTMTKWSLGGDHDFVFKGAKKKRSVYYRGFQGNLIPPERFEALMAEGCTNCQVTPTWGNKVKFFSATNFLCEHCSIMPHTVRMVGSIV